MFMGEREVATVPADGQPLEVITHPERSDGDEVSSLRELEAAGFTVIAEVRSPFSLLIACALSSRQPPTC